MPAQGFMLVHPRLHAPSPKTALTFLRWTKVHFRDLVLLPASPGIFTHCLRNVAPVDDAKYSHTAGKGMSPYFYTIVLDDVHALHSQAYADVSRKLDLEHTRALVEGEEAVSSGLGEEAMVWDVVDARFAVFVEEQNDGVNLPSYQQIPARYTTPSTTAALRPPPPALTIAVTAWFDGEEGVEPSRALQRALLEAFPSASGVDIYASVYTLKPELQPPMHPEIFPSSSDGTPRETAAMVCVALIGEGVPERDAVVNAVEGVVGAWRDGKNSLRSCECGVWGSEVWFGRA